MWFRHRAWIPISWGLSALNVAAVWFAAQPAEPWHATIHAALGAGFALGARHLAARRHALLQGQDLQETLDQNEELQRAIDEAQGRAAALKERIAFAERLLETRRSAEPLEQPRDQG